MESMKSSGIDFAILIPLNWQVRRLKYIACITTGNKDTINASDNGEYPFFVRSPKILRIDSYSYDGEAVLLPGEGDVGKIFHYINGKFDFHQRVYCLYDFMDFRGKFLWYYLSQTFINEIDKGTNKTTVESLRLPMLQNFTVCSPPLLEQCAIVAFLDARCEHVNNIIFDIENQINILKKYKKALITETVIKGLEKTASMKRSGIDWIGDIPSEWIVKNLRFLGTFQNGISKDGDSFGSGSPFVSYSDVYNNFTLPKIVDGLVESNKNEKRLYSVQNEDVFFTRTSETIEEIGFASICRETIYEATFAGFLIRFRPTGKELLPGYAIYYFRADALRNYFVKEMTIVTRASLGQNLLKNLPVLLPPHDEQRAIAEFLDNKCAEIDNLIAKKQKAIETMQQYRKSIIYEYVTGKKRVES